MPRFSDLDPCPEPVSEPLDNALVNIGASLVDCRVVLFSEAMGGLVDNLDFGVDRRVVG